jgi:hexosaminidase
MKYDADTPLGLDWAGKVNVRAAYDWDPATQVAGVTESDMLGIEAAVWTETLDTTADLDYMIFPRLLGHAEIGWSPQEKRAWETYKQRLSAHGPRLDIWQVNAYRSAID